jgi:hypothetical protein
MTFLTVDDTGVFTAEDIEAERREVLGYLRRLRKLEDSRVEAAFAAVLCDIVADGGTSLAILRRFADRPTATRATTDNAVLLASDARAGEDPGPPQLRRPNA